jgi:hypothetical protein
VTKYCAKNKPKQFFITYDDDDNAWLDLNEEFCLDFVRCDEVSREHELAGSDTGMRSVGNEAAEERVMHQTAPRPKLPQPIQQARKASVPQSPIASTHLTFKLSATATSTRSGNSKRQATIIRASARLRGKNEGGPLLTPP